jgi:hypothetical protein
MLMVSDIEKLLTGDLMNNKNQKNNGKNDNSDLNYRMGTNIDISGMQIQSSIDNNYLRKLFLKILL